MSFLGVEKSFPTIDFVCASAWNVNRKDRKKETEKREREQLWLFLFYNGCFFFPPTFILDCAIGNRRKEDALDGLDPLVPKNNKLCHLFLFLLLLLPSVFLGL